jgi:hypothetical protein
LKKKKKKKRTLFPTPKKRRGFYEKNTNLDIRRGCCAIHAIPQLLLPGNPEILQRIDRSRAGVASCTSAHSAYPVVQQLQENTENKQQSNQQ